MVATPVNPGLTASISIPWKELNFFLQHGSDNINSYEYEKAINYVYLNACIALSTPERVGDVRAFRYKPIQARRHAIF